MDDRLHAAAAAEDLDGIAAALAGGADVDGRDPTGRTPLLDRLRWTALLEAILRSEGGPAHQAIVGLLIEHGADVDLADGDGVRPLAHARARGQAEIVALLEAAGAHA